MRVAHVLLVLAATSLVACGSDPVDPPIGGGDGPDPITSFAFLTGTWNVTSRWLEASGFTESQAVAVIASSLDGRVLKERWVGTRAGRMVELLSLYGRSDVGGQWIIARGDGDRGTFDVLQGSLGAARVALSSRTGTRPDAGRERIAFDSVTADRFLVTAERSTDGGATFATYWTMEYRRAPAGTILPAAPDPAPGCADAAYRGFDFWVGDWDVGGSRNMIPARLGGCIIEENWTSVSERGTSFNMYDARTERWSQVWIDTNDNSLFIQGGVQDGVMAMEWPLGSPSNRITWTPLGDGRVRQLGESSGNGGASWTTLYDLTYVLR
jgi:hypothetical protein